MMKLRTVLITTAMAAAALSGTAFAQGMAQPAPAPMAQPSAAPMPGGTAMQGGMMTHQEAIPGTDQSKAGLEKDPLVKKRVADAKAKRRYKMKKKAAHAEAKEDVTAAKQQMKAEKKQSSMERSSDTPAQIPVPPVDRAP